MGGDRLILAANRNCNSYRLSRISLAQISC